MIRARADTVGSLLRPSWLKEARERYAAGDIDAAQFKRIEDAAVDEVVRLQEEVGLEVITDGEMRRVSFQGQLAEAVEGLGEPSIDAYTSGATGTARGRSATGLSPGPNPWALPASPGASGTSRSRSSSI